MFGILLPEPLGADLQMLAERVLQSFRDQPVVTSVTPVHITVSLGGVKLPAVAKSSAEAMIFAEQALHDAHQRGRNLFVEYIDSPERAQENRQLLELGERIKHAFKNDGFRLAYQPIIDTKSGQNLYPMKRWCACSTMKASRFQQHSSCLRLSSLVWRWSLIAACSIWRSRNWKPIRIYCLAINVSGLTAAQADWPEHVRGVLEHRRNVAERLIVEITETAAIVDMGEARRFAEQLCELGGRVSLDDFGAGFTSIRHLRSLSLSIMKIDKDLLHNVMTNAEQQHLVLALIGIGARPWLS